MTKLPYVVKFHSNDVEEYCRERVTVEYDEQSRGLTVSNKKTPVDEQIESREFDDKLSKSEASVAEAFAKYAANELAICFDGGKDGHIVLNLLEHYLLKSNVTLKTKISVLNIIQDEQDTLEEPRQLVRNCVEHSIHFKLVEHVGYSIRESLAKLKEDDPVVKAIFMGVRRTDAAWYADLDTFQITDQGWPQYMRINPILDWSYQDVWRYLTQRNVPYCTLYAHGYTSLGRRSKCGRNPLLRVTIVQNGARLEEDLYLPAKCLPNAQQERFKRGEKSPPKVSLSEHENLGN